MTEEKDHESSISGPICIQPPKGAPISKSMKGMKPIHQDLPQTPFFVCTNGPRHRGKTVLLYNLLEDKPGMYGSAFKKNNIYIYSPTADRDETLKKLKLPTHAYKSSERVDLAWMVNEIRSKQKNFRAENNQTGVLLVLDDITNIRSAWPPLEDLAYYGRHDHIHVIYVAHKMSSIPRGVRTQTQQWIIFEPHEQSEHQWILEMFSRRDTWDIWRSALLHAWSEPFQFVFIDFECKEDDRVYRKGFQETLFSEDQIAVMRSEKSLRYKNPDLEADEVEEEDERPKKRTRKSTSSKRKQ